MARSGRTGSGRKLLKGCPRARFHRACRPAAILESGDSIVSRGCHSAAEGVVRRAHTNFASGVRFKFGVTVETNVLNVYGMLV